MPETKTPAADEAAAATGENAAPAHVERGEVDMPERDYSDDAGFRTVQSLIALDERCREHGHSIADVITVAAKNAFGIDVRDYGAPDEAAED